MDHTLLKGLQSSEVRNLPLNLDYTSDGNTYKSIFKRNAFTVFNTILFPLSGLLFLVGSPGDAMFNCAFILLNTGIAIFQEAKAKYTLDRLKLIGAAKVVVIRDAKEISIPQEEVVLGDLVKAGSGEQIIADGDVIYSESVSIDESLLTGESDYVQKRTEDTVTSGTFVVTGELYYKTTAVGSERFASKLLMKSKKLVSQKTKLEKKLDRVLYIFLQVMIFLVTLQIISQILKAADNQIEFSFNNLVLQVSTIVSALVPTGLILITSISYAIAARKMYETKVLVNKIAAVESTCHLEVLCMDKTGTITTNQIVVEDIVFVGKNREGFEKRMSAYSSHASKPNKTMLAIKDHFFNDENPIEIVKERPFESKSKYSGMLFSDNTSYYIGAPEILLSYATGDTESVHQKVNDLFKLGKRCLIVLKTLEADEEHNDLNHEAKYDLESIIVLKDTIRPEAEETIKALYQNHVDLKIISGDNHESVAVIARAVGFTKIRQISGIDMSDLTPEDFEIAVLTSNVFGRITPEQKERIIQVLQRNKYFTGMIGDGVNDVLSIKKANLGIAMNSGVQMAKDVADLVLLDNSFGSLPIIISQGEQIYSNIIKVSKLFVAKSIFFTLVFILFGYFSLDFPFFPRQLILVLTVILGIPSITIALLPLKREIPKNFYFSVFKFSIISGLIFAFTGLFAYLGTNVLNNSFLEFGKEEELLNISRMALVLTLVFGGLMNVGMVTMNEDTTELAQRTNKKIFYLLSGLFTLFITLITIPSTRDFFGFTSMNLLTYLVVMVTALSGGYIFYSLRKLE
jgi:cation-transporting P-type ATPase E